MRIGIGEARELCEQALLKCGLSKLEAELVAGEYIEGELQGKHSHGLLQLPSLVRKLGLAGVRREWKPLKVSASSALVDGNLCLCQLVGREMVEVVCRKAQTQGIGLLVLRNVLSILRPATYAEMIAERGMLGVVGCKGVWRRVAPPGGIDPVLGTSPIGVGIPTEKDPILVDMATSKRAWQEVTLARAEGRHLEEETYLDKEGGFTVNPKEARAVVPMDGYKGFTIGMLIEVLAGSLAGMPVGEKGNRTDTGVFFIAIDPSYFGSLSEFKRHTSELSRQIKSSRKALGANEILLPGERATRTRVETLHRGYFDVEKETIDNIQLLLS